jgi:phage tail sheath gpL-like
MSLSTAVPPSAKARVVGIKTEFKNLGVGNLFALQQRVAVVGQGATGSVYSTDKFTVSSASEAGTLYGFGSPVHLAVKQLLPATGDGVSPVPVTVYPLVDDGAGVAAAGDVTPVVTQTKLASYKVVVNNIESAAFLVDVGATVADVTLAMTTAINATLDIPIVATDGTTEVTFVAKWKGASSNDLVVSVVGDATAGSTFGITQPVGGATNPNIDAALAQVGNVWETVFLNCLDIADTSTLDKYSAFGEGRWGALVRKPMIAFTGNTIAAVASAVAVSDARATDRTNSQLVAPGSIDLPFVVAARQLARIAVSGNTDPAQDFGGLLATGLTPGADGDQWDYSQRDIAVNAGSSTVETRDGVVTLSDILTFYHPTGDATPAYSYVVDVYKLQNILYNLNVIFESSRWEGNPLIPNDQATNNRNARKPKHAVADIATMVDNLGLAAIISDPETAKTTIQANINESNPKRLDIAFTVQLSGNANVISIDFNFGFFFGQASLVA